MGLILDKISGNPLLIDIKEADLDSSTRAKLALGRIAGIFTTELPTTSIATDKVYEFAGSDGAVINTITWRNGDSAFYNGSAWVRIPFQSISNSNISLPTTFKDALSARYGTAPFPCFLQNNATDIDTLVNGTPRHAIYQSFRTLKIYGSDNTKRHKISLFRKKEDVTDNYQLIIYRENSTGVWASLYSKTVNPLTVNANGVTRWDYTVGTVRVVADLDLQLIPDKTSTVVDGLNNDEPAFIINYNCIVGSLEAGNNPITLTGLATVQTDALSARSGLELFPCFVRYKAGSIDTLFYTATEKFKAYSAIKHLRIYGSDTTKLHKMYLFRRNEAGSWAIIIDRLDSGTWTRIYYGNTSVTENTGGITRWNVANAGINVVADIQWDYVPVGASGPMESPETADPIMVIKPECIVVAATKFTDLPDVPNSYTGQGGKQVKVNAGGTALEFVTDPVIPDPYNQDLNTTDAVEFASITAPVFENTGTIPTGTLASPPAGLVIGDQWADTTDSATHPIIRIKVA